ncbi:uncharacterized protein LOC119496452 isoform X1 [Sebastes umbrosus]|uniref:uncharacterized protein LOC119496452 isoform X1 n=1 Tax=Sebastes umbrosus TaxID=72105 RepID=UPI0018A003FE|nr:uncharacterized protein LOC119496452 isoform X1 [Sebastes umbrosus]
MWRSTNGIKAIEKRMEECRKGQMRMKRKVSHICLLLLLALLQITAPSLAQDDDDTDDFTDDTDSITSTTSTTSTRTTSNTSTTSTRTNSNTSTTSTKSTPTTRSALRYSTRPAVVKVAVGQPAVFRCGVPAASPNFTFTLYGSHGNFILKCPFGHEENIPQVRWSPSDSVFTLTSSSLSSPLPLSDAILLTHRHKAEEALYGSCGVKKGQSLGVWVLKGSSFSDNGTRVVCQQAKNPKAAVAFLRVYDNGLSFATLIGCAIGGFFGILLVFGLAYTMLQRSDALQRFFRGSVSDDMTTIITKE